MSVSAVKRPSAEAIAATWRWLQESWGGEGTPPIVAIVGLGDGAVLDAFALHAPETKILAVEPNPSAAASIATHPIWQAWRASGQLVYLCSPEYHGADQAWRIFPAKFTAPALVIHRALEMGPEVAKAAEVLKKILVGADANSKAREKFAPRYLLNSLRNLAGIVTGPSVERLRGAFTDVPAIIVGAGPSLDRSYDDLRAASGRALIIATDTTLRPLLAHGIVPQLVIGLDPSEANARHFFALPECRNTWLIAESALDPRATALFAERTFWCAASHHHPWPWLIELGAEPAELEVWGSVLTGAFTAARLAGCDPIITVGADLALTGGRPYARCTTYEFDWAWAAAFGTDVDASWRARMQRAEIQLQPDLRGKGTPTTPILIAFRDWILAQAKKDTRKIINASREGTLFGEGIEQADLLDVLGPPLSLPASFAALGARRNNVRPTAIARGIRELAGRVARGEMGSPMREWAEFMGVFDPVAVVAALEGAAGTLETKRGRPDVSSAMRWDLLTEDERSGVLGNLPELVSRLRFALRSAPSRGTLGPASDAGPILQPLGGSPSPATPAERADLLVRALELMRRISDEALRGDDFVSWPDPSAGDVPAGGSGMWPETLRWSVLAFEGLLGRVWHRIEERPEPPAFASGLVPILEGEREEPRHSRSRPFAAHACVLLVVEWLRCTSSLDGAGSTALRGTIDRLSALERLMRTWPLPGGRGAAAELVVEATGPRSATVCVLPLGLPDPTLARILSGAVRDENSRVWEIGRAAIGSLCVRIGLRAEHARRSEAPSASSVSWPTACPKSFTPVLLTDANRPAAVVAGSMGDAALIVTPFTSETSRVDGDGTIEPYQKWPRPITGAMSLGVDGELAWSNVWASPAGPRPFLMYRSGPGADVQITELPFRPSSGVWWRGRVYWNCQPTPHAAGGIGSWAPGEDVRFELADLILLPIVPVGDALCLASYRRREGDTVVRGAPASAWIWRPGEIPVPQPVSSLGAMSAVATAGDWTAHAYPQADVIEVMFEDAHQLYLRCHYPLRLAWTGRSLLVSTGERELLCFPNVQGTIAEALAARQPE